MHQPKPKPINPHDLSGVWMMHPGGITKMIPEQSHPPMTPWAQQRFDAAIPTMGPRDLLGKENDPLLKLRGSGKEIWANEHADEYIRRLRKGWE